MPKRITTFLALELLEIAFDLQRTTREGEAQLSVILKENPVCDLTGQKIGLPQGGMTRLHEFSGQGPILPGCVGED